MQLRFVWHHIRYGDYCLGAAQIQYTAEAEIYLASLGQLVSLGCNLRCDPSQKQWELSSLCHPFLCYFVHSPSFHSLPLCIPNDFKLNPSSRAGVNIFQVANSLWQILIYHRYTPKANLQKKVTRKLRLFTLSGHKGPNLYLIFWKRISTCTNTHVFTYTIRRKASKYAVQSLRLRVETIFS